MKINVRFQDLYKKQPWKHSEIIKLINENVFKLLITQKNKSIASLTNHCFIVLPTQK